MVLQKTVGDNGRDRLKAGSRNSDGNVPKANWNDGKFKVNYYNPDNANDNLRARSEVSARILHGSLCLQELNPPGCHLGNFLKFFLP